MEVITLLLFCVALILCICFQKSVIIALVFGLVLFSIYAYKKGFRIKDIWQMYVEGLVTSKNVIVAMALIGMLTALWRAAGTIPAIICYASGFFVPAIFLLVTFLLNSMVSFLTGSSFCTAATMGVICATIANTMGIPAYITGGAILSGAFFGDRCSPVSTSALLVSEITHTNIYDNIKGMMKTSVVPFIIAALFYLGIGFLLPSKMEVLDVQTMFRSEFVIHPLVLLPAIMILVLAVFRVNIKTSLIVSMVISAVICLCAQGMSIIELGKTMIWGYAPSSEALKNMISGGGIVSMMKVIIIIVVASSYSGIFQKTGLLDFIEKRIGVLAKKYSPFATMCGVSVLTGMIACNQTLTIILTKQICMDTYEEESDVAIALANSAVVIAGLIPWSIAGSVPLMSVSAPLSGMLFAVYLYLLPIWQIVKTFRGVADK